MKHLIKVAIAELDVMTFRMLLAISINPLPLYLINAVLIASLFAPSGMQFAANLFGSWFVAIVMSAMGRYTMAGKGWKTQVYCGLMFVLFLYAILYPIKITGAFSAVRDAAYFTSLIMVIFHNNDDQGSGGKRLKRLEDKLERLKSRSGKSIAQEGAA